MCLKANCNIVILSNDDILFDSSIKNIINLANKTSVNKLLYYGPSTNKPGPAACNKSQYNIKPTNNRLFINKYKNKLTNLNGFFMVFPKHVLLKINIIVLNTLIPHFHLEEMKQNGIKRFIKKGGKPVIVPRTFIYHYKIARWRKDNNINNKCIYTVNTGGYEGNSIYNNNNNIIDYIYITDNFKLIYKCISLKYNTILY